jgi:hypothetical protein
MFWREKPLDRDPAANQRRHGRLHPQGVECSLGSVLDISASGMRVEGNGKPIVAMGETAPITIHGFDGPFMVVCRVCWIRKTGWRVHQIGVVFVEVSPVQRAALCALARTVASNEVIRPDLYRQRDAG